MRGEPGGSETSTTTMMMTTMMMMIGVTVGDDPNPAFR
jgi:hypothetical protein